MSFLTLEDVNGAIQSNAVKVQYHEIDTSLIGDSDFTNVKYDFVTITRIYRNNKYNFYVTVDNNLWTGGYYVLKTNHEILHSIDGYDDGVLYIGVEEEPTIIIGLVLQGDYTFDDRKIGKKWLDSNIVPITLNELNTRKSIRVWKFQQGEEETYSLKCDTIGVKEIGVHNINAYIVLMKTDFQFNCNQSLTVGKVNKVYLGTNADYKPSGDLVGDYTTNISVDYKGTILPVSYDGTDYYFNLDLTDKTIAGKVKFKVIVESNEVLNASETEVVLNSDYQTVSSFNSLLAACNVNGIDIIRLGGNLTATADIPVKHSIKIIGNNKSIDLDGHKFILDEDISFNAENIQFNNGDTTIIQQSNTKVELTSCTFNNCTSTNYNGLGSCIFCDVDIDSLDISNDYITTLTDCLFTNNSNCILHGGELLISNCRLHNTDLTNINTNNVAFLYQTDGAAVIQNSIFDIDYTDTTLCTNETNIGFAQAIVMCGETAIINDANYVELGEDNSLPLFEIQYKNKAHIFAEYYYPQISACVYTSPSSSFEDRSCCHAVSGVDWVFKNNAQVTRASAGTQNETRKITWE